MLGIKTEDHSSLKSVTPAALASYARAEGWLKIGTYRDYSDVYGAEGKPEIIVPRTAVIDDYEMAVSDLIKVFGNALHRDDISIYRDLTVADKDVLRIRALDAPSHSLPFEWSTRCSTAQERCFYRPRAHSTITGTHTAPGQLGK